MEKDVQDRLDAAHLQDQLNAAYERGRQNEDVIVRRLNRKWYVGTILFCALISNLVIWFSHGPICR